MECSLGKLKRISFVNPNIIVVTIESIGIYTAEEIFLRALKVLEDKAKAYVI